MDPYDCGPPGFPTILCTDPDLDPDTSINKPKKVRITLIFTIFFFFLAFYLSKCNLQKVISKKPEKNLFFVSILSVTDEKAGSGSGSPLGRIRESGARDKTAKKRQNI